jgi:carbon storage regulator
MLDQKYSLWHAACNILHPQDEWPNHRRTHTLEAGSSSEEPHRENRRKSYLEQPTYQEQRSAGMLVLTRKVTEEIKIGDQIVVKLLGIKGQCVRIGIEAPRSVRVMRSELVTQETDGNVAPQPSKVVEIESSASNMAEGSETTVLTVADEGESIDDGCTLSVSRLPCATRTCPAARATTGRSTLAALVRRQSRRNKALSST